MSNLHIKIKYFSKDIEKLCFIDGKSDWIDLRAAKDVSLKAGESAFIPLGVGMELPKGYEAHVVPRSSSFKNFGIIQTNSMGVIDESYSGDEDEWKLVCGERYRNKAQRQNMSVQNNGASAGFFL